jgi:hypothetical protein
MSRYRRIDGIKYLIVDGHPPSQRELSRAARSGNGVIVEDLHAKFSSMSFLASSICELRFLSVPYAGRLDVSVLADARSLVRLDLWADVAKPFDLSQIRLAQFSGRASRKLESIQGCGTLQWIMLDRGRFDWIADMSLLSTIRLNAMPGDVEVPSVGAWQDTVVSLTLDGRRSLTLDSLEGCHNLSRLELSRFKGVNRSDVLARMTSLESLHIEDVYSIDGVSWSRRIPEVNLVGHAEWIRAAVDEVGRPPKGWSVPPWAL